MLKTRYIDNDINVNTLISAQDYSSDRDQYNNKLLNLGTLSVINAINDSEVFEFKPNTQKLNFNIFFLRYLQDRDITEISPYMESQFANHITKTKIALGIIDDYGYDSDRAFSHIFEIRQADNKLRSPRLNVERNETSAISLTKKPYTSSDKIGESLLPTPVKSGIPIFYNSYTIPLWDKKDDWKSNELLYINKPYFNNSFMLMEFYDSPSPLNQNRILSTPVFVNSRYNIKELNDNGKKSVLHERPSFNLTEGSDGYSFFFLNNFIKNDFYVKFSFWDAANGNKIPLVPSCDGEKDKKWFQKRNTFKQEYNYLKYVLDYNSKTYKIYEYNTTTNDFDLERTNFDLYELSFDQYFESVFVSNEIPFDATTLKPKTRPFCPLKFGIRNLYTDKYLGRSVAEFNRVNYTQSNTFLYSYFGSEDKKYHTGRFLDKIENYIKNKNGTPISKLQSSEFVYPKISEYRDEIVVNGYTNLVQNFFAHNVDTEQWKIRKLSLQDIAVTIDDKITYDKSYYQEMESSWEMPNRDRISESMTLMISNTESIQTNTDTNDFIKKIMISVDFVDKFVNYIDDIITKEASNSYTSYGYNRVSALLDKVISKIGYTGFQFYQGYIVGMYDENNNYVYKNQFNPYKNSVLSKYNQLVISNDPKVLELRKDLIDLLPDLSVDYSRTHFAKLINIIYDNFNPITYVDDYLAISSNVEITQQTKDELNKIYSGGYDYVLSKITDTTTNLRDYLFNVIVIQDSDRFVSLGETIKFSLNIVIGDYTKQMVYGASKFTVTGKLKISLIDLKSDIKNIYVPINIKFLPGNKPMVNSNTIVPQINQPTITI